MRTRTRGAQPVSVSLIGDTPKSHAVRFSSYLKALGGETLTLIMSDTAVHRTAMALLRMCRRINAAILPEKQRVNPKRFVRQVKVKVTKEKIARWRAYQQVFIEMASRASERWTDGYGLKLPRYVVLKTEGGRYVAFSLWRGNAIYITRTLSALRLPKRFARQQQGTVRICRTGDWREAVLRFF